MKMTWTNLNQWRKESTILDTISRCDSRRRHKIAYYYKGERLTTDTNTSNQLWREATREFEERFGVTEFKHHHSFYIDEMPIYICTSIYPGSDIEITGYFYLRGDTYFKLIPPKNMEYTPTNISRFVTKYMNRKILFPPGEFRAYQIANGLSKEEVFARLRVKPAPTLHTPDDRSILRSLRRKFNITAGYSLTYAADQVAKFAITHGRAKRRIVLERFTYDPSEVDGDIDQIEREFWESFNRYPKNTVFI